MSISVDFFDRRRVAANYTTKDLSNRHPSAKVVTEERDAHPLTLLADSQ